jgi:uncharacterized protein (TIGR00255 family)
MEENSLLKSMTGYGRGEVVTPEKKFTVELKAVNHRFCEVVVRLPKNLIQLEDGMRQQIQAHISRGRVDCYFSMEEQAGKNVKVKVDKNLVTSYYKAIKEVLDELGIAWEIRLEHLLALPGLLVVEEPAEDLETLWPAVEQALGQAVHTLREMRRLEGGRLEEDIRCRVQRIEELNREIENRTPLVTQEYRSRLTQRLQELLPEGIVEPGRLITEVAIFAERSSIAEEVVRIYSHLSQLRLSLEADEAVGRKLDFLIQEINREVNTIASKANDLQISQVVVEVKSEIEKIREQIQNIE